MEDDALVHLRPMFFERDDDVLVVVDDWSILVVDFGP